MTAARRRPRPPPAPAAPAGPAFRRALAFLLGFSFFNITWFSGWFLGGRGYCSSMTLRGVGGLQPWPPACPACWDHALKSDSMDHHRPTQRPGPGRQGSWPTAVGPGPALPTKHRTSAVRPLPSRSLATGPALAQPWVPRGVACWAGGRCPSGLRSVHAEHVAGCSMPHAHSSRLAACPWGPDWGASLPALSQPGSHLLAGGPSQEPCFTWFRFALTPSRLSLWSPPLPCPGSADWRHHLVWFP